jgi:hypothetical protein
MTINTMSGDMLTSFHRNVKRELCQEERIWVSAY